MYFAYVLTLKALITTAADDILSLLLLFFRENKAWEADDSLEISNIVFSEN